ncbi:hypothetical protein ACFOUO_00240 [Salinithrix halophila]|uniref:Uncharacterized protein n=2 Tax=Salinithrix halophila TaxID=1485204 RepID=A0ABV8JEN5_9BACL
MRSPWSWVAIAVLALIALVGVTTLVGGSENQAETTALAFFKAGWVDGDPKRARGLLDGKEEPDIPLDRRTDETRRMKPDNSPVLLANEELGDTMWGIYIHRPRVGDGLAVTVAKDGDKWRVVKYRYNMASRYEILKQTKPQLEWKEVQP